MPPAKRKSPARATAYDADPISRFGRWRLSAKPLWLECSLLFAFAFASTFFLRACVVEARFVPSASMTPTFEAGDRLLVEKVSRYWKARRGEVVVFAPPARAVEAAGPLIKRVVAIAGDVVAIQNGRLLVNGRPQMEQHAEAIQYPNPNWADLGMPGSIVPPKHFLALGDHRNSSLDSHIFGPIPNDHLIGRPLLRIWPPQRFALRSFWNTAPTM